MTDQRGPAPREVDALEHQALERLIELGEALALGVEATIPSWALGKVEAIVEAWGGTEPDPISPGVRAEILDQARAAGAVAARRVGGELRRLLRADPAEQRLTPLELLRGAHLEVTSVLANAGVPSVARDPFAARAFPEDRYAMAPRTFSDIGEGELPSLHLAWGVAKATALGARRMRKDEGEVGAGPREH